MLVADDVLTSGGSVRDTIEAVLAAGGEPVAVAVLVDRSGGRARFDVPLYAAIALDLAAYEPPSCPLCAEGAALTVT